MRKEMIQKTILAALAVVLTASCTSVKPVDTSSDRLAREQRRLGGFNRIELLGNLDVKYQQADTFSVWVEAPREVIGEVETRVEDRTLTVNMRGEGKIINFGKADADDVTVYVTSPDFLGIRLRGSGDFDCMSPIDTDTLDVHLKGSGDIEFGDVVCDRINASVTGSGDLEVKRLESQLASIELIGSGDIKMRQQHVAATDIVLKGSGDVKLRLDGCRDVRATLVGSGDITLQGDVDRLSTTSRGSGDIHSRDLTVRQK